MYEGDLEAATKHIHRAILMDPFYVDAYFDLANIHMQLCRYTCACVVSALYALLACEVYFLIVTLQA